jgi:hypothetical protein
MVAQLKRRYSGASGDRLIERFDLLRLPSTLPAATHPCWLPQIPTERNVFRPQTIALTGILVLSAVPLLADDVHWQRINLDKTFRSEGVAAFDVNHDGKIDVVAGDVWYEAPDWKMHEIRNVGKYDGSKGYSNSFCNFGYDVNGDGWEDLVLIGFPGAPCFWY